jgi:ATP-dependent exoDNAse (exonuclease V) alpha subunit
MTAYINLESDIAFEVIKDNLFKKNIFITGQPGSGKTYLTNKIIDFINLTDCYNIGITASTGIASKLINGKTIHSWSGLNYFKEELDIDYYIKQIDSNKYVMNRIKKTNILIVDEVSLLSAKFIEILDLLLKYVKKSEKYFGNIKVIMVGDFYQLPPVQGKMAFESEIWDKIFDIQINLTSNYRTKDNKLINILSKIRQNLPLDNNDNELLKSKVSTNIVYPTLVSLRVQADKINKIEMDKLYTKTMEYSAIYNKEEYKKDILKYSPLEDKLTLKIGVPVIYLINNSSYKIYNGSVGTVVDFVNGNPKVKFNQTIIEIEKHTFRDTQSVNLQSKINNQKIDLEMTQYPLLLAFAITIHRSQGQTLSQASIILDKSIFENGQAYVALSRLQSIDNLTLIKYNPLAFKASNKVKDYYHKFT